MIRNKILQIIWLINRILTIIRITYGIAFWQNFRNNWSYWTKFISDGYVSLETRDTYGMTVIQTIFYLFGDINVNIRSNLTSQDYQEIIPSHIRQMEKFKEQVLFFIPVVISLFLNVILVFYFVYQIIGLVNKIG